MLSWAEFADVRHEARTLAEAFVATLMGHGSNERVARAHESRMFDVCLMLYISVLMFVANWAFRILVVAPIGGRIMVWTTGDARKLDERVAKLSQSAMEIVFYGLYTFFGVRVLAAENWLWPSSRWWDGFDNGDMALMSLSFKFYYLSYCSRYLQAIVSVLIEPKRSDTVEMLVHHVVTVVLVWGSYVDTCVRIGAAVMLTLDPADVPLHMAKILLYCARDSKHRTVASKVMRVADVTFAVFVIVFTVTRMIIYPYISLSSVFEGPYLANYRGITSSLAVLLQVILLLQVYWFYLVMKVLIGVVCYGERDDVREKEDMRESNHSD